MASEMGVPIVQLCFDDREYCNLRQMRLPLLTLRRQLDDLRGKTLAVDAIDTGYAPILVYMLGEEGLTWKRDYELRSVGDGPMRIDSMRGGETAGGLVRMDEALAADGFHTLLTSADYISAYARGMTAARRDWAAQNEELLVRYARAMVRAINWVLNPKNKDEALSIIARADGLTDADAAKAYAEAIDPAHGFIADARIDPKGIEQILKIREATGAMRAPLPPVSNYVDERFHRKAIATLADNDP